MMGSRIGVGREAGGVPYYVDIQAKRDTTTVALADDGPFLLPFTMGVGLLAWQIQMPAVVPATGDWSFVCPILSEFPAQVIGTAFSGTSMAPLRIDTGVLTTTLSISANQLVTLRGLVTF